jgi:hypothetical protein
LRRERNGRAVAGLTRWVEGHCCEALGKTRILKYQEKDWILLETKGMSNKKAVIRVKRSMPGMDWKGL